MSATGVHDGCLMGVQEGGRTASTHSSASHTSELQANFPPARGGFHPAGGFTALAGARSGLLRALCGQGGRAAVVVRDVTISVQMGECEDPSESNFGSPYPLRCTLLRRASCR